MRAEDRAAVQQLKRGYPVISDDGRPYFQMAMTRERTLKVGPTYNHVEVNLEGKHVWLQKLVMKLISKLGMISHPWRNETITSVVIERRAAPFMEQLCEAINDIRVNYNHEPTVCFIGNRDLMDAMRMARKNARDMNEPFGWDIDIPTGDRRLLGLRVIQLPWLDGVFLA